MSFATGFSGPGFLAFDGTGNLYLANHSGTTVSKVTALGAVSTFSSGYSAPIGVAFDRSGNFYVSDRNSGNVYQVPSAGTAGAGAIFAAGYSGNVGGLAFDSAGRLYVADSGTGIVYQVPVSGSSGPGTIFAESFDFPVALAFDGSGNLYVAAGSSGIIYKVPSTGSPGNGVIFASGFRSPTGLAFDTSGALYVAESFNGEIYKVPPAGSAGTGTVVATGFTYPTGLAFDAAGSLYVADLTTGSVSKITLPPTTMPTPAPPVSPTPTPTPTTDPLPTPAPTPSPSNPQMRLVNISTRAQVGNGPNILIPGFVVGGAGVETLLIRADGPALASFGVPAVLARPSLSVFDSTGRVVASNTGWSSNFNPAAVVSAASALGAFVLVPGSADSALVVSLPAGAYTVQVSGVNATTGVALAELYEVSSSGTHLVNGSVRGQVGTGAGVLILGFVVSGSAGKQVLVEAAGPALAQFGVSGVLARPSLSLVDAKGVVIATNTGWSTNENATQLEAAASSAGAFSFAPLSADSALLLNLQPGAYTAIVSGVNSTTGIVLTQIFEVP
jgi:sugar lactone lactonase YvrE